ncbi:MAG: ABC transporter ATP-binding protein [Chloroflexi bacterium]|nr:ABC transporter ATP-binding protein [Chloroflexota bacterium]MYB83359.1 ABC transporter ATP-binding protein [Chloroflexota bacterium]
MTDRRDPLLTVDGLSLSYQTRQGEVQAIRDVSFELARGSALGLVGESGCGKTSVANCLMRLLPDNARLSAGRVLLDGQDVLLLTEEEMRLRRWRRISMVFQAAMNVLDPVYRVGQQIIEAIETHGVESTDSAARERVARLFRMVGLDPQLMERYPHEFSGGMRQRAVIAMALSCDPDLMIADEPTTALDVIVQDRILRELKAIQQQLAMSIIYISHDIAVVAEVTDVVGVMYAGRLVEMGDTSDVFRAPAHPYTAALMSSFPSVSGERRSLTSLPGEPPNLSDPPQGCPFHPRCAYATDVCRTEYPPRARSGSHWAACWHPLDATLVPQS